jgi:hypothetical protein
MHTRSVKPAGHLTTKTKSLTRTRVQCGLCDFIWRGDSEPDYCPHCGADRIWSPRDSAGIPATRQAPPLLFLPCPGFEPLFPKGLPVASQLWSGEPGCGKSRLAMMLGSCVGNCGYISLEMPWAMSRAIAKSTGSNLRRLRFWESVSQFLDDAPSDLRLVVVDSVQYVPRPSAMLTARLIDLSRRRGFSLIWISQVNAQGRRKGGPGLAHAVDVELTLKPGSLGFCDVTTRKNRLQLPSSGVVSLPLALRK